MHLNMICMISRLFTLCRRKEKEKKSKTTKITTNVMLILKLKREEMGIVGIGYVIW